MILYKFCSRVALHRNQVFSFAGCKIKEVNLLKILQSIVVKQILTEKSKIELLNKFSIKINQLQKECDQLKFEAKKVNNSNKYSQNKVIAHFEKEIEIRQDKIKQINFQINQLNLLPIGSELKEREVQAIVEVDKGDSWNKIYEGSEIIIKDGIIHEIR